MGKPETKISELCDELGIHALLSLRSFRLKGEFRPDGKRLLGREGQGDDRRFHYGAPRFSYHFRQKPRKAAFALRVGSVIHSRHCLSRKCTSHPGARVRAS
jgi:hypothetical protein